MGIIQNNRKEIDLLNPFLRDLKGIRILDIGCGAGTFLSNLYERYDKTIEKLIGVDIKFDDDDDMHVFATKHNIPKDIIELYEQDGFGFLNELTIPQDLIIFSNMLHFYEWPVIEKNLTCAFNKLSNKGLLYIKVGNEFHKNSSGDKITFTMETVERIKSIASIVIFEKSKIHYDLLLKPNNQRDGG